MADALSVLRQYYIDGRLHDILEREDKIIFGDFAWPKTAKTNYLIYRTGKDGKEKEYYTLDCILFLLKNVALVHSTYVKQAATEGVPVVRRPDRKDLLAYLKGDTSANVDKTAPLEMSMQRPVQMKRAGEDVREGEQDKRPRLEEASLQKQRDRLEMKLNAPFNEASIISNIASTDSGLTESMSIETISAIKAKIIARKRTTIKGDDQLGEGVEGYEEGEGIRDVLSKERHWRARSTILQSPFKEFSKNIFAILQNIKVREEGDLKQTLDLLIPTLNTSSLASNSLSSSISQQQLPSQLNSQQAAPIGYSRYDQERFSNNREEEGFKIDTMETFHGLTLKSVTEGVSTKKTQLPFANNINNNNSNSNINSNNSNSIGSISDSNISSVGSTSAKSVVANKTPGSQKKTSKTPIIIIPATNTSIITMYNVKDLLQDFKFVDTDEKKASGITRENEVIIHRQRAGSISIPFRVIDNPLKLNPEDWHRVVAVFVQGPSWQFKKWPWGGNPVEIFSKVQAFHLYWLDQSLDANIRKWSVHLLGLNRHRRHLDRACFMSFWETLDRHMAGNKAHLRF